MLRRVRKPTDLRLTASCARCGEDYRTYACWIKKGMRFCSKACSAAARSKTLTCKQCGGTWTTPLKSTHGQSYCSQSCFQAASRIVAASASVEWFESQLSKTDGGCWNWNARFFPSGYGRVSRGHGRYAHRLSYRLFVGPIPSGLTIDHLCFNKRCVNPAHLEAVTLSENVRRYWRNKYWPERRMARSVTALTGRGTKTANQQLGD